MEVLGVTDELLMEQDRSEAVRLARVSSASSDGLNGPPPSEMHSPDDPDCILQPVRGFEPPSPAAAGPAFGSSTPVGPARGRPRFRDSPIRPRGPRLTARDWSFLLWRRNRRRRNLNRKISYSDEGELSVAEEPNKKCTGLRWKKKKVRNLKFVDDGLIISKMNMDTADVTGQGAKSKHDLNSQNIFRRIVRKAESRGMVVNKQKTKILCISDAQFYQASCRILDSDGNTLRSGSTLKVLGFHLDSRPAPQSMPTSML